MLQPRFVWSTLFRALRPLCSRHPTSLHQAAGRIGRRSDAMGYHVRNVYTLLLTAMCFGLLLFLATRLLLSMRNRNKLLSWSTCFYLLCLLWTVVRLAYWIMVQTREDLTYLQLYLLYWFPTPIQ